jgi:hypothetical protein
MARRRRAPPGEALNATVRADQPTGVSMSRVATYAISCVERFGCRA